MATDKRTPGPKAGSDGARRISEAHKGSKTHDRRGGFAANPELAREAGRKGGETVRERYGADFYQEIGKKGGDTVRRERGSEFFAEIGRKGGQNKGAARRAAAEAAAAKPAPKAA
jgi:general stress protein YciG